MKKILLVCTGNTCRSPMAQALFVQYLDQLGDKVNSQDYQIVSAGIYTRDGLPASSEAVAVMKEENIDLTGHRSRQITGELINAADIILTMSTGHRDFLRRQFPDMAGRIFDLRQFSTQVAGDVEDPYGAGIEAYRSAMKELKELIPRAAERIISDFGLDDTGVKQMQVVIGCDHAGVQLKMEIIQALTEEGYEFIDCGTDSSASVDYPDFAEKLGNQVVQKNTLGVLICGTGIGISIAANKIPGIRAAVCQDIYTARLAREHNDANVLAMGARVIGSGLAMEIIKTFINTDFLAGRHQRRVDKITALEKKYMERS